MQRMDLIKIGLTLKFLWDDKQQWESWAFYLAQEEWQVSTKVVTTLWEFDYLGCHIGGNFNIGLLPK